MVSHFEDADEEPGALPHPWAVHDAESGQLVGFAMISDGIPEPIDDDMVGPYFLWRLLIDESFQGRGYGAATIDAIAGYLGPARARGSCTPAVRMATARRAASTCGTASPTPGEVKWDENVLALELRGGT